MTFRNLLVGLAAGSLLMLVGCGSSSDTPTPPPPPEPEPVDTSGIASDAMVQAGSYKIDAGASATHGEITYSCAAGGANCTVDVMADGTTTSTGGTATAMNSAGYDQRVMLANQRAALVQQINALRTQLGLDADDDVGASVKDLQDDLAALQKKIDDRDKAIADAAAKAMTEKGKAIYKVLDTFGETTAQTAIGSGVASSENPDAPDVAATYGKATGLTVAAQKTFVDTFTDALATITTSNTAFKRTDAGDPEILAANYGFSGTMLTWTDTARADTMTVYTDVSAPSGKLFSEAYGGGTQTLTLGTSARKGVTGAAFDGRTGGKVEHDANAKSTTSQATDDVVKLPGRFMNAVGSYTCTPASDNACTSAVSEAGVTFGGGGGWTFTANTGAMVSVPDGNGYMTFGWWMRDDKATAAPLDNVAAFYNANAAGATAISGTDALSGTAKYEGGAAGKYAWKEVDEGTAHGGHFTAKASLTASFTPGVGNDTLSGSISDFRLGEDGMDPDWTVTLAEAAIGTTAQVVRGTGDDATVTVWAVGPNKSSSKGGWEALLSNSGAERNDDLPTGVAGAFDGEFGEQGRMIGGFGANITNQNPPK